MNKAFSAHSELPLSQRDHSQDDQKTRREAGDLPGKARLQTRVRCLINSLCDGMYEREEIIAVALLGAMCGQNSFLYGPPGTAKSLISRRIACAFERPEYFEYLMNRFSTPEEVFGPVSIKDLKEDRYTRKTKNYLPTAEFAFLDEIWKSSPAILNTLLTLVNERVFRNGTEIEKAPLKALIAASNETPEPNQGLEALFDRFIIRLFVGAIEGTNHFERLLNSKPTDTTVNIPEELAIGTDEWSEWRQSIHDVQLSSETLLVIRLIRERLAKRYEDLQVYVSDRRWQRAAILMKGAAFFNDRQETNHSDAVLLQHCLWSHGDNRDEVMKIVAEAIRDSGFDSGVNLANLDRQKDDLDKEINKELYHSEDVYDTKEIGGKQFIEVQTHTLRDQKRPLKIIYIPFKKNKSKKSFHPVDKNLNELSDVTCNFDGQGTCKLEYASYFGGPYRGEVGPGQFRLPILFHKGDKKSDVNPRLVEVLKESAIQLREEFKAVLELVDERLVGYDQELASPFIPKEKAQLALSGINAQIESLKLRIADCDRLEALCQ